MDEHHEEIHDIESQLEPEQRPQQPTAGFPWGGLVASLGIALVVVFAVQNNEPVPVQFLWIQGDFPLSIIILVTALTVSLFTAIGGIFYRRRRLKRRAEKQELRERRERS